MLPKQRLPKETNLMHKLENLLHIWMGLGLTILHAEPLEWHLIAIHLEALTIRICSGSEAYMFNESHK